MLCYAAKRACMHACTTWPRGQHYLLHLACCLGWTIYRTFAAQLPGLIAVPRVRGRTSSSLRTRSLRHCHRGQHRSHCALWQWAPSWAPSSPSSPCAFRLDPAASCPRSTCPLVRRHISASFPPLLLQRPRSSQLRSVMHAMPIRPALSRLLALVDCAATSASCAGTLLCLHSNNNVLQKKLVSALYHQFGSRTAIDISTHCVLCYDLLIYCHHSWTVSLSTTASRSAQLLRRRPHLFRVLEANMQVADEEGMGQAAIYGTGEHSRPDICHGHDWLKCAFSSPGNTT